MTNIEQFEKDVAYNANNILFTMTDDEVMGQRGEGVYVKDIIDEGHECRNFIFDSGRHYVLDKEEQKLYVADSIPSEYFIHKYLEKAVSDFVKKWQIDGAVIYCAENEISAESLIRLLPYREEQVVRLPNIMIPIHLKHKGIGKKLVAQIYEICKRFDYRLILVDVVDSFYNSLKKRNAKLLDFDTLEITQYTKLD